MERIYLIAGGTGFVGNNVIRRLIEKNQRVRTLVRNEAKARQVFGDLNIEFCYGDVRDIKALRLLFPENERAEYIFIHAAAIVDIGGSKMFSQLYDINVNGTNAVISICKEKKVKRLIYISSVSAIKSGKKKSILTETTDFDSSKIKGAYAKTKAESTSLILNAVKEGLDAVIVFPSGIIGPYDYSNTHLTQMIIDYNSGRIPAAVTGGYDFVDVRDISEAILTAADTGVSGSCWLLTNRFYSVRYILSELYNHLHKRKIRITFPLWLAYVSVPFANMYAKIRKCRPLYTRYSLSTLHANSHFCCDKARKELNYSPRELSESIKDTIEFLRSKNRL